MQREPFKTTVLGIIFFGVLSSLIAAQLGFRIEKLFHRSSGPIPTATPLPTTPAVTPKSVQSSLVADPRKEQLGEQYDSFNSRFSAIESSLQQRAHDLGNLPMKPEITQSIQTTRSDLAEAQNALLQGDFDRAALRLKRVEKALKYLESL